MLHRHLKSEIELWHERYGHLNVRDLRVLQTFGMVEGLHFKSKEEKLNCLVCSKAKIHSLPFKPATTRADKILGLIYTDIWGPERVQSLGGSKYFVTFIDDKSMYTEIAMLSRRSDVLEAFKKFKKRVETETGQKIIKIRSDNNREYTG